jgi:hypothetical protein
MPVLPEYLGWSITVRERPDGFTDLESAGWDRQASMERFCELLREKLTDAFPGATLNVRPSDTALRAVEVWAPPDSPGRGHAPIVGAPADDPAETVLRAVDHIRDQLYVWGDYNVEATL